MKVKGVLEEFRQDLLATIKSEQTYVADSPSYCAFLCRGRRLVRLTVDA